ncbi:hypothetical protein SAMN05443635_101484 [Roseobacter denitrificans OCh 114]|nr:hypothetical protein SAMN05443635_101484 [Roseobacter denitrificans OCh 114]
MPFSLRLSSYGAARRTGHSLRMQNSVASELTVCGTKRTRASAAIADAAFLRD